MSSDNVIEGVVRFLWAYNSNYKQTFPVYEMSEHATSRFRMATKLSDALKVFCVNLQKKMFSNIRSFRKLVLEKNLNIKHFFIIAFLIFDDCF